ncbi:hypothetical protein IIA15_07660 [candidate division TA06 bacterium]|nr:hypothetical protein [candidate division TA06 bacterium]
MKEETLVLIENILEKDPRYKTEAYGFVLAALTFTQKRFNKKKHVSGRELLEGIRELALDTYGPMTKSVFNFWGVRKTEDFGEIVFNLVETKLLGRREEDRKEEFKDVYDFEKAFRKGYKIGSSA